jgi:hypothetical protein
MGAVITTMPLKSQATSQARRERALLAAYKEQLLRELAEVERRLKGD